MRQREFVVWRILYFLAAALCADTDATAPVGCEGEKCSFSINVSFSATRQPNGAIWYMSVYTSGTHQMHDTDRGSRQGMAAGICPSGDECHKIFKVICVRGSFDAWHTPTVYVFPLCQSKPWIKLSWYNSTQNPCTAKIQCVFYQSDMFTARCWLRHHSHHPGFHSSTKVKFKCKT